ncbi:MAG: hypothetical protein ACRC67_27285 [Inquilinus sp.]|uniref:hypothetical protein n=1 Tax=Inquilinus sp. TaxID=1932117 RepID=UPI003F378F4E
MHNSETTAHLPSWRDGAFLTTEAAGQIIGCSAGNVRDLVVFGILKAVRNSPGGRLLVTVESVAAYIADAQLVDPASLAPARKSRKRARRKSPSIGAAQPAMRHLRLVVNNDHASP